MNTLIAIDWGSTHRRAYRLHDGQFVDCRTDTHGVLTCAGDFAHSLDKLLAGWSDLPNDAPVLMSGMIGSRAGWIEAPYLPCPASILELGRHLVEVPRALQHDARRAFIVPGVCRHDDPDVMRGEEIQILGSMLLGGGDGLYVLPGTHSKWVMVRDGQIRAFRSFMTGELFALLGKHSSLASMLGDQASIKSEAFEEGVRIAMRGGPLSHDLFSLRAGVLLKQRDSIDAAAWLSGLLIGSEWHDPQVKEWLAGASAPGVRIVGETELVSLHGRVADTLDVSHQSFDPQAAFVAAARHIWNSRA